MRRGKTGNKKGGRGLKLEHKTCNILAAERLQLMIFDNRLIIDSLKAAHCSLLFSVVQEFRKEKQAFCDIKQKYCVVLPLVKEKLEHLRSYQGS